jgi:4-hydroxy-3-methylbut-2-en-1-yl diphosphate synthase IspG/GcpE
MERPLRGRGRNESRSDGMGGQRPWRESKHASLGISLPGIFEEPKAPVYVDGRLFTTLKGDHIVAEFIKILDEYVESHYAAKEEVITR